LPPTKACEKHQNAAHVNHNIPQRTLTEHM